jgi:pimeloyl-ACP methyl ester carboxylesterase
LLAQHFTVLRRDRRSFGQSRATASLRGDREDALALLDEQGIERAVVLGMSQGARVALDVAVTAPHRIRALILDGAPLIDAEQEVPLDEYRQLRKTRGLEALRTAVAAHPLMQLTRDSPQARSILHGCMERYRGEDMDAPEQPRSTSRATAVSVPALILVGEADSAARRKAAQLLRARIPGSQLTQIGGCGHLGALDDPPAYSRAVIDFCNTLPPQAQPLAASIGPKK